jgi:hypothetical protein
MLFDLSAKNSTQQSAVSPRHAGIHDTQPHNILHVLSAQAQQKICSIMLKSMGLERLMKQ